MGALKVAAIDEERIFLLLIILDLVYWLYYLSKAVWQAALKHFESQGSVNRGTLAKMIHH